MIDLRGDQIIGFMERSHDEHRDDLIIDFKSDHMAPIEQDLQVLSEADANGLNLKIQVMQNQIKHVDKKIDSTLAKVENRMARRTGADAPPAYNNEELARMD